MRNRIIASLVVLGIALVAARDAGPGSLALRTGPHEIWKKSLPAPITGLAAAADTGEVVAATNSEVYLFRGRGIPAWTAGQGQDWKHVEGLGISRDGGRIAFQTDTKPKGSTEAMALTIHLLDREGKETWQKPNPGRYQSLLMSPGGNYLLLGEILHPGATLCDHNLNPLWKKDLQFWHLQFDPTDKYLLDGEGGKLYSIEGAQVWDFGPWTKVLSVSDQAGYVMTRYFRTAKASETMFLSGRREMKTVELKGAGGCLSPDGSLAAWVSLEGKLGVFATADLLASGPAAKPLFTVPFTKPWVLRIGRDNRTLLALGAESGQMSVLMLVDVERKKPAWRVEVDPAVRVAVATADNREVTLQSDDRTLVSYRSW